VATSGVGPRFFRQAPFVILDEPTAALDPRAEHDLFDRIRTLLAGRTVLLISHRFSLCETPTVLMCWTADTS
jgi:ATP-binding cassette, subfamily B, bacterial